MEALVAAARRRYQRGKFASGGPEALRGDRGGGRGSSSTIGPGFDPDSVPDDRRGVRESIIGRMKRYGGRAEIRSARDGTEVELAIEEEE
jgi:hypothetical protein